MRLVSPKFHDYYDTSIAYGIDEQCFFKRDQTEYHKNTNEYNNVAQHITFGHDKYGVSYSFRRLPNYYNGVIFFCGHIYKFYVFEYVVRGRNITDYTRVKEVCFNEEETLDAYLKMIKKSYYRETLSKYKIREIEIFFNHQSITSDRIIDIHFETGVPIIYVDSENVVYNPRLLDYNLQRKIPATEAFQQISQFISGVLGGQSPMMVQLEDVDLIRKRGYDKWSFRKMPEKRR